jgi:uncharacterized membrane protein
MVLLILSSMQYKKRTVLLASLLALIVIIKWFSTSTARVEAVYATGIYTAWAKFLRYLFGWLPFSIGDILYGIAALWIVIKLVTGIKMLLQKKTTWTGTRHRLLKLVVFIAILYVVFNSFWGINYNRQGIAYQLGLKTDSVSYNDLKQTTALLIEKLNSTKQYLLNNKIQYPSNTQMFKRAGAAYHLAQEKYPFLQYKPVSLKSSLWGWLGNYTGFTGYYNPFTGEAQVNTSVPKFLQPFIACHEVAHQLGYAKENEANSVGYITALHSGDSLLLYSTYFDLYNYASRELYFQAFMQKDTMLIKDYRSRLLPQVKDDLREVAAFFNRHRNLIEPVIRSGYSFYLKSNNQPMGLKSYDEVTAFLIAYYKKFGKI